MARKALTLETIRTIFARTGNQCAFPECTHPLVDEDNQFIAQICHIEAAARNGERFNETMTDEQRRAPDNLIVLCYRHHVKTNNVQKYSVEALKKMKSTHERKWLETPYKLPTSTAEKISRTELQYWKNVNAVNDGWLNDFNLAMKVKLEEAPRNHALILNTHLDWFESSFDQIQMKLASFPQQISAYLREIGYDSTKFDEKIGYTPFDNVLWETMNLGVPNFMASARIQLQIIRVHLAFTQLKNSPEDSSLERILESEKADLIYMASNYAHVD